MKDHHPDGGDDFEHDLVRRFRTTYPSVESTETFRRATLARLREPNGESPTVLQRWRWPILVAAGVAVIGLAFGVTRMAGTSSSDSQIGAPPASSDNGVGKTATPSSPAQPSSTASYPSETVETATSPESTSSTGEQTRPPVAMMPGLCNDNGPSLLDLPPTQQLNVATQVQGQDIVYTAGSSNVSIIPKAEIAIMDDDGYILGITGYTDVAVGYQRLGPGDSTSDQYFTNVQSCATLTSAPDGTYQAVILVYATASESAATKPVTSVRTNLHRSEPFTITIAKGQLKVDQ